MKFAQRTVIECPGDAGCLDAVPIFSPASGSMVQFPVHVSIASSIAGGKVHYTTNGDDPDENSAIYSAPVEIDNDTVILKAVVVTAKGCVGPVTQATYSVVSATDMMEFEHICNYTGENHVGEWNVFAPGCSTASSNPPADPCADLHFKLTLTLTSVRFLKRIDIFGYITGLGGAGWGAYPFSAVWTTHRAIPDENPSERIYAFPIVIFSGLTQLNNDYKETLGPLGPGRHVFDLWCQKDMDYNESGSYFKCVVTFRDGTQWRAQVPYQCIESSSSSSSSSSSTSSSSSSSSSSSTSSSSTSSSSSSTSSSSTSSSSTSQSSSSTSSSSVSSSSVSSSSVSSSSISSFSLSSSSSASWGSCDPGDLCMCCLDGYSTWPDTVRVTIHENTVGIVCGGTTNPADTASMQKSFLPGCDYYRSDSGYFSIGLGVGYDDPQCRWTLSIASGAAPSTILWQGRKNGHPANGPGGTYIITTGGCNTSPPAIEVTIL